MDTIFQLITSSDKISKWFSKIAEKSQSSIDQQNMRF